MRVSWVDSFSARPASQRDEYSSFPRRRDARVEAATLLARSGNRLFSEPAAPTAGSSLPIEVAFLASYGVPLVLLQYGSALARRQGVSAAVALLAEGLVSEETFYRALAAELEVSYLDGFADLALNLAPSSDIAADAERGFARLAENPRGLRWVLAPRGAQVARLIGVARLAHGRPLFALTTPSLFADALRSASPRQLARAAAFAAERANPALSARLTLRRKPLARAIVANGALLVCLIALFPAASFLATFLLTSMFLANVLLRLFACAASFDELAVAADLDDRDLPNYSILIALYREASVARQLARAIDRLDYPRAKLDVKFIVEFDDIETAVALRANAPRTPHEIIVAPPGAPRTKPRALNVAMPFVRGSLVAVFDAEDLPEPDQLRKAAALFASAPQQLACLQASLCIDNGPQNWMTGLFAIDYAMLFDVFNNGLAAMGLPFFLGGSSNHFRVQALRDVGCWDAYNVTEDADLGLRLARAGYATRSFLSRTFEEAPSRLSSLLRQRTRWIKGWMQTALVHCRNPRRLFADLGFMRAFAVLAMFTGGFAGPLLAPFFTALLAYQAAFGNLLTPVTPIEIALSSLWCCLALYGCAAAIWPMFVAMRRQRLMALWPALFFAPAWMLMLTLAAWRALRDLWMRPFHWEKTEHGCAERNCRRQANSHCLSEKPELKILR